MVAVAAARGGGASPGASRGAADVGGEVRAEAVEVRAATSEGERTAVAAAAAAAETAAAAAEASVGEGGGRAAARVVVVLAGDAVVRKTNQAIVITPGIFVKKML